MLLPRLWFLETLFAISRVPRLKLSSTLTKHHSRHLGEVLSPYLSPAKGRTLLLFKSQILKNLAIGPLLDSEFWAPEKNKKHQKINQRSWHLLSLIPMVTCRLRVRLRLRRKSKVYLKSRDISTQIVSTRQRGSPILIAPWPSKMKVKNKEKSKERYNSRTNLEKWKKNLSSSVQMLKKYYSKRLRSETIQKVQRWRHLWSIVLFTGQRWRIKVSDSLIKLIPILCRIKG